MNCLSVCYSMKKETNTHPYVIMSKALMEDCLSKQHRRSSGESSQTLET